MAVKIVSTIVSVLALCFAIPSLSLAEDAYEITVTIGDTTLPGSSGNPTPIAGNYTHAATGGSITITNVGAGGATAKVELTAGMDDGMVDSIRLINAKITANNNLVTNFPITFKRRMLSGPIGAPYYKMYAKGLFNQASGSSINLGWFVKNPLSSGFFFLDSKQYTPGALSFTINPAGKVWPPPAMNGDRVLKVEFTLKLANGKWLDFDSTVAQPRLIRLYSSGVPVRRECGEEDPECIQDDPPLYIPYQDEASKVVGLAGEHCEKMFKEPEKRPCIKDKGEGSETTK